MNGVLDYVGGAPGPAMAMDPYLLMGLGMLGNATQPGGVGIGQGAMQGLQAYQQAQQMELQNTAARAQLAQAGKWGDYVAGLPPEQQELLGALGPAAGAKYLTEQMKQQGGGAWEGSGFDAQAANMYNALMAKVQAGIPLTPEEEANLSIAYQRLTQPKMFTTPSGTYSVPGTQGLPTPPGMAGAPSLVGPGAGGVPGFTPKPPTEGERKAASYYERMSNAVASLERREAQEDFDPAGYDPRNIFDFLTYRMQGSSGPISALLGSLLTSEGYQGYANDAEDFITALLRYESGAAVPEPEFYRYYSIFFPLPGQGTAVKQQKAERRAFATRALEKSAGRALSKEDAQDLAAKIARNASREVPISPSADETPAPAPAAAPTAPPAEDEDEVEVFY